MILMFVRGFACLNLLVTGFVIVGIFIMFSLTMLLLGIVHLNLFEIGLGLCLSVVSIILYEMTSFLGKGVVEAMLGRTLFILALATLPFLHLPSIRFTNAPPKSSIVQKHLAQVTPAKTTIIRLESGTELASVIAATLALLRRKGVTG